MAISDFMNGRYSEYEPEVHVILRHKLSADYTIVVRADKRVEIGSAAIITNGAAQMAEFVAEKCKPLLDDLST